MQKLSIKKKQETLAGSIFGIVFGVISVAYTVSTVICSSINASKKIKQANNAEVVTPEVNINQNFIENQLLTYN